MCIAKPWTAQLLILTILFSGLSVAAISEQAAPPTLPQPSIEYEPAEVVKIVIEALANNDQPFADAGIATTFAFASPTNKLNTGPLSKFTRMVKNQVYGIMVDHLEHQFSKVVLTGNKAYQMVRIVGASGAEVLLKLQAYAWT